MKHMREVCWLTFLFLTVLGTSGYTQIDNYQAGDSFKDCSNCPDMVVIPQGSFSMGKNDSTYAVAAPVHNITIDYNLSVSKYPITVGQFRQFIRETGHMMPNFCWTFTNRNSTQIGVRGMLWDDPGFEQEEDHPVVCVSWADVQTYLRWLNRKTGKKYRLLSEAEWEYIARADQDETTLASISDHSRANIGAENCCAGKVKDKDAWLYTSPVTTFSENNFGVFDMAGNVQEWVADCVNGNYNGAPNDGSIWTSTESFGENWGVETSVSTDGQCLDRIARGPAWIFPARHEWYIRRGWWRIQTPFNFIGFRVAQIVE